MVAPLAKRSFFRTNSALVLFVPSPALDLLGAGSLRLAFRASFPSGVALLSAGWLPRILTASTLPWVAAASLRQAWPVTAPRLPPWQLQACRRPSPAHWSGR